MVSLPVLLASPVLREASPDLVRRVLDGAPVRFGSYGDPAAAPSWVWSRLAALCGLRTGYTHRADHVDPEVWSGLVMASADSEADRDRHRAAGWRTFRVAPRDGDAAPAGEVECPATTAAASTCATCGLCAGVATARRDPNWARPKGPLDRGWVLYEGPSEIDGAPIVVIITGLSKPSANVKTADLLQTWILRADVSPSVAAIDGRDASVCGDCPHRAKVVNGKTVRSCYVAVWQAPRSVWAAYHRGSYPRATLPEGAPTPTNGPKASVWIRAHGAQAKHVKAAS